LLDIGCGQGDFIHEASISSWKAFGIEFSPAAVSLCQRRGLQVVQGSTGPSLSSTTQCRTFDVVTAFEVLEHLRDPGDLLNDASMLLDSGGLLYLTTPNFNAFLRHLERDRFSPVSYPDHLCFFTPASLRILAARHGFRVAALRTTGLDPWRLKHALRPCRLSTINDLDVQSNVSDARTVLRVSVYERRHMALLKAAVNSIVNVVGAGDTLKAWLVKV
jgi:SAM-dependent methyltransferase